MAGMPISAALLSSSSMRAAPSSIEYSVWTCRCAKLGFVLAAGAPEAPVTAVTADFSGLTAAGSADIGDSL